MNGTIMWSEWEQIDCCEKLVIIYQKEVVVLVDAREDGVIPYLEETGYYYSWKVEEELRAKFNILIFNP